MKPWWDLVSSIRLHPELPRGLQITKQREGLFLVGRKTNKICKMFTFPTAQVCIYTHVYIHNPHTTKNMKFLWTPAALSVFCTPAFSVKIWLHLQQFSSGEAQRPLKSLCLLEACPCSLGVTATSFCVPPLAIYKGPLAFPHFPAPEMHHWLVDIPRESRHV